jgi:hypothetical protein
VLPGACGYRRRLGCRSPEISRAGEIWGIWGSVAVLVWGVEEAGVTFRFGVRTADSFAALKNC